MLRELFFLCTFFGLTINAFAQKTITLPQTENLFPLGTHVAILEDKAGTITFEQASSLAYQNQYKPSTSASPNQAYARSDFWFRVHIRGAGKGKAWFLQFQNPNIDTLHVYFMDKNQKIISQYLSGDAFPHSQRPIHHALFTFPVPFEQSETLTIYIKFEGIYAKGHNLYLLDQTQLLDDLQYKNAILIFVGGILFALLVYNALLFFAVGGKDYLFYVLYLTSLLLYMIPNAGLGYQYLYPHWRNGTSVIANLSAIGIGVTAIFFAIEFLHVRELFARWVLRLMHTFAYLGITLMLLLVIALWQKQFLIFIFSLISYNLLLDIALLLTIGIAARIKGSRQAIFFLLAWSALLVGGAFFIVSHIGLAHPNIMSQWGVQIGTVLEALLLSFGLADRIKVMEREKRNAQRETIEALKQNEQIIRDQNDMLEKKVKNRTIELAEANDELATFNEELNQTNEELQTTLELVNFQKEIIENKNRSITDSINYAKRIQESILPTAEEIKRLLPQSFLLFRPRDIVSGDFYFLLERGDKIISAAIDCTGHGVPGALMSMIGKEILEQIILEGITEPNIILNRLHKYIRKALKQRETSNRDGMDLALVVIDRAQKQARFAGAKNPLYYIQNQELHTIKGDKMPIGGEQREYERVFTTHIIALDSPTYFYLCTDGFQDQFGGMEDKKFGTAQLKSLFLQIHTQSLDSQQASLADAFDSWLGKDKQIDDVLIFGFLIA